MNKEQFIALLKKNREGVLTEQEQQFLEGYYDLFREEPDIISLMTRAEKNGLKGEIKWAIQEKIREQETKVVSINHNRRTRIFAAAAAVLVLLLAGIFYSQKKEVQLPAKPHIAKVNNENRIIFLPDGSKVILSPGSKLNYPTSFDGRKRREVYLNGQAFFDIKHNEQMPFVVHTGKLETVVLGTAFNIKALPYDENIAVTVSRGKVKVIDTSSSKVLGVLTPNQQILYCKKKVSSEVKIVNQDSVLEWRQNNLLCDNLTITEVSELLEEKFNVKFEIVGESLKSQRFTTTFAPKESLDNILKSICLFNDLEYVYDVPQAKVTIKGKE